MLHHHQHEQQQQDVSQVSLQQNNSMSLQPPPAAGSCSLISNIEQLPTELLTQILSELDQTSLGRCAQLSRFWLELTSQPQLWRKIRIDSRTADPELAQRIGDWPGGRVREISAVRLTAEHRLPLLLAASASLTSLSLKEMQGDLVLKEAGRSCQNLRELRLECCNEMLSFDSVSGLLTSCPSLSLLQYTGSLSDLFAPSDEHRVAPLFHSLVSRLSSLKLHLLMTESLPPQWFAALPECPRLASLYVSIADWRGLAHLPSKMPNLTDLSVLTSQPASQANLQLGRLPHLQRVKICDFSFQSWSLDAILSVLRGVRELWSFMLDGCVHLTGQQYRQVVRALPARLTDLRFGGCFRNRVAEVDLQEPLPPGLRRLQVDGFKWGTSGVQFASALASCS
uniref:F-box domain-containing protein n=1 Tax=Macrostomum lignano TaxID=282301 RepID=A0A1I8HH27_9PLAT